MVHKDADLWVSNDDSRVYPAVGIGSRFDGLFVLSRMLTAQSVPSVGWHRDILNRVALGRTIAGAKVERAEVDGIVRVTYAVKCDPYKALLNNVLAAHIKFDSAVRKIDIGPQRQSLPTTLVEVEDGLAVLVGKRDRAIHDFAILTGCDIRQVGFE